MFTVELRFKENGTDISLDQFADEIAQRLAHVLKEQFSSKGDERFFASLSDKIPTAPVEKGPMPPKAVGVAEAARLLGIRPPTLRVMVMKEKIRVVRIGRRVLVPMETIDKILQEGVPRRD